jgi:hypothetical protein
MGVGQPRSCGAQTRHSILRVSGCHSWYTSCDDLNDSSCRLRFQTPHRQKSIRTTQPPSLPPCICRSPVRHSRARAVQRNNQLPTSTGSMFCIASFRSPAVLCLVLLLADLCCSQPTPKLPDEPCPLPMDVPQPKVQQTTPKVAEQGVTGLKRHIPMQTSKSQGSSSGGRHLSNSKPLHCQFMPC